MAALAISGCYAEAWVGAERRTLDGQRGDGWVAGASIGTFWGAESPGRAVVVNAGLATATRRGGGLTRSDADGVRARVDLMATSRLGLSASGDLGWVRTLEADDLMLRQQGRVRRGALGVAFDAIVRPNNTGTLALSASRSDWSDLPVAQSAVGVELSFRWLWASPSAFGCDPSNPSDCYTPPTAVEGPGLLGAFLSHEVFRPDAPLPTPTPTCSTVETCSSGRFGMRCSSSTVCR